MAQTLHKIQISKSALENNINLLSKNVNSFMPVVKFDGYGHGLVEISKLCLTFENAKKLQGFAVGTIEEGVELRKSGIKETILSLLGETPLLFEEVNAKEMALAKEHNITIVAHSIETLKTAVENNLSFGIKWNTGMNRFGINENDLPYVLEYLDGKDNLQLKYSLSHLAMADDLSVIGKECTASQAESLKRITKTMQEKFPRVLSSLGQSANILSSSKPISDISRLGASMYGINPFYNTEWHDLAKGLQPVMNVIAPILTVREIEKGIGSGYGLEARLDKNSKIAVVGIGYSNGYRRTLISQKNNALPIYAYYQGKRIPRVGRVCMQVAFFDVTDCDAKVGDYINILGGEGENAISPDLLASWWDTISYEIVCQLSNTLNKEIID